MKRKTWVLIVVGSGMLGLLTATALTFLDWRLNPAGIFHQGGQTNWDAVFDTALSWFLPLSLLALIPTSIIGCLMVRRRKPASRE